MTTLAKLGPWWQQGVAMGYQIHIGKRAVGQTLQGEYSVTATKSVHVTAPRAWKELISEEGVALWLRPLFPVKIAAGAPFETADGFFGEIRTVARNRRVRLRWQDPNEEKSTGVELLIAAPPGRVVLVINHVKLRDRRAVAPFRARWRAGLEAIAKRLAAPTTRG